MRKLYTDVMRAAVLHKCGTPQKKIYEITHVSKRRIKKINM